MIILDKTVYFPLQTYNIHIDACKAGFFGDTMYIHVVAFSEQTHRQVDRQTEKDTNRCLLFSRCQLFKANCLCLYDISLWSKYSTQHFNKFRCCYHKCMKAVFGYSKFSSLVLLDHCWTWNYFNTTVHNTCPIIKCR